MAKTTAAATPIMGEKVGKVQLEGKVTHQSGFAQIVKSAKQGDGTLLQIHRKDKYLIDGHVVTIPSWSANTFRSMIRDNIARDIVLALDGRGEKAGYQDMVVLFCGGGGAEGKEMRAEESTDETPTEKKGKKQSLPPSSALAAQIDVKRRNVVLSLLGASALKGIIAGKTVIGAPVLICKETVKGGLIDTEKIAEQTTDLPSGVGSNFIDVKQYVKKDDLTTPEVFSMLSEAGRTDMVLYETALAAKKKAKQDDPEAKTGTETSRQMIFSVETIIPGAKFYHYAIIKDAASVELGAFLSALKRFAEHPYLGGLSARGCGRIAMNYTITINGEVHGAVVVDDNGFSLEAPSDVLTRAMEDYRAYLGQVTAENISVEMKQ